MFYGFIKQRQKPRKIFSPPVFRSTGVDSTLFHMSYRFPSVIVRLLIMHRLLWVGLGPSYPQVATRIRYSPTGNSLRMLHKFNSVAVRSSGVDHDCSARRGLRFAGCPPSIRDHAI